MGVRIHPIHMGMDTIYAIQDEGVILVDGGDPGKLPRFERGLAEAEIDPREVRLIVVTHGHWDHVGSVQQIKELTGAPVLMHQQDMHFLQDTHPAQPPGLTPWGKMMTSLIRPCLRLVRIPAFEVDLIFHGDDEVALADYGVAGHILHTPGHTYGSVSVLLEAGEAFVGDLAMNKIPLRLTPGLPIFGDDERAIRCSWQMLLDKGARIVYPAHGDSFSAEVMRAAVG